MKTYQIGLKLTKGNGRLPLLSFFLLFCLFYLASPYQFNWTTEVAPTAIEAANTVRHGSLQREISLSLFGAFALITLIIGRGRSSVKINHRIVSLLVFYFFWAWISLTGTGDYLLTLRKIIAFALFYLIAFWMARRFSVREVILFTFISSLLILILSLSAELFFATFHPLEGDYRFAGIMHPNHQGWNCALLFIASCTLAKKTAWKHRIYFWLTALISVVFLLLTKSRAAVWGLFVTVAIARLIAVPKVARLAALLGVFFFISLAFLILFNTSVADTLARYLLLGRINSALSLSGRVPVWRDCISFLLKHPLRGYGYNSFWTPRHIMAISGDESWTIGQAHNGYLEIALGMGFAGLACFCLLLTVGIMGSWRLYNLSGDVENLFMTFILIFVAADSLFESIGLSISIMNCLVWVVFFKMAFFMDHVTPTQERV